jgi:decaprenyl-phosphate phosphoribosyltransferase
MRILETIRLIRPKQYIKNLFVIAPIFFSGLILDFELLIRCLLAFVLFSVAASSIYILNDIMDINEDKRHPEKKNRPIASGAISIKIAKIYFLVFMVMALLGSYYVSTNLTLVLGCYILINILYSLKLKNYSIVDISLIAIGFVLRIFAGSAIIKTMPSMWIILMTFLLALFLALAKRRDDILLSSKGLEVRKNIQGYNLQFVNSGMNIMAGVVIVSYILYTVSAEEALEIGSDYLYLTVFFVIMGILRYLQIAFVESNSGSPTKLLWHDRFLQFVILIWLLSFGFIIYGAQF